MKRVPELMLRLVLRLPKGASRKLAVTAPADLPARAASAALSEAAGLDPGRHQAIRLSSGVVFGDAPLSSLGLRQGDEIMLREIQSNGSSPARPGRDVDAPDYADLGQHTALRTPKRILPPFDLERRKRTRNPFPGRRNRSHGSPGAHNLRLASRASLESRLSGKDPRRALHAPSPSTRRPMRQSLRP